MQVACVSAYTQPLRNYYSGCRAGQVVAVRAQIEVAMSHRRRYLNNTKQKCGKHWYFIFQCFQPFDLPLFYRLRSGINYACYGSAGRRGSQRLRFAGSFCLSRGRSYSSGL